MGFFDFLGNKNKVLGIDIGTAGIKIVEIEHKDNKFELINYGLSQADLKSGFKTSDLSPQEIGLLIKKILKKMDTSTKKTIMSLPLPLSFSVLIEMPAMGQNELTAAIPYEAKKYIPVPIDDVALDWLVVDESYPQPSDPMIKGKTQVDNKKKVQVLLVAVPSETIKKYTQVAKSAGLQLQTLEIESFAMARSLVSNDPKAYLVVDFGTKGTNVVIIEKGDVRFSYNIEDVAKATVLKELTRIVNLYKTRYNKNIERCILTGGSIYAQPDTLKEREREMAVLIKNNLGLEASFGNPLARLDYPPKLENKLKDIAPSLAVAIGLAMKQI